MAISTTIFTTEGIGNLNNGNVDEISGCMRVNVNLWMHEGEWKLRSELAGKGTEVELYLHL